MTGGGAFVGGVLRWQRWRALQPARRARRRHHDGGAVSWFLSCWFRWFLSLDVIGSTGNDGAPVVLVRGGVLSWCQDHGGRWWWFLVSVVLVRGGGVTIGSGSRRGPKVSALATMARPSSP